MPSRYHMDGYGQDILSRSKVSDNYIPPSVNLHKCSLPRSVFVCFLCVAHLTEIISIKHELAGLYNGGGHLSVM